ncbi:IS66 family insertion sequence element accessory protein TnpB [Rhizobium hidalgonense]|uniref:IS66 family insertion sequence element accessory protein TnpB n=1 Tax=Rhizobium hidalgonense TaxID=1538159 RepID=UPI00093B27FD
MRHEQPGAEGPARPWPWDPDGGEVFCFRGRKGDLIKVLWHDGVGMSLYLKRLEAGKFIWPVSQNGSAVPVSSAQLGYLLEGIDWRNPRWTQRPSKAGWPPAFLCFCWAFGMRHGSFRPWMMLLRR